MWDPVQDMWHSLILMGRLFLAFNLFVSLFGLVGLLLLYRAKSPYAFPIAMFPLIYPIVYYVTHTSLRYRHPMDPVLMVSVAFALTYPAPLKARRKQNAIMHGGTAGTGTTPQTIPLA
jgi:signal transduction histidine kinase